MIDHKGNLHCNRCGAFVQPDRESNINRWRYSCNACMSNGTIPISHDEDDFPTPPIEMNK